MLMIIIKASVIFFLFFVFIVLVLSGKKQKKPKVEVLDFEIPVSFWWELKHLYERLMENVNGNDLNIFIRVCV